MRVFSLPLLMAQLCQRTLEVLFLQIIDYAPASDAFDITQYFGRGIRLACDHVKMIGHDYVRKDQKAARASCFIQSLTGHFLNSVSLKDGQTVFGDHSNVECL